MEKQIYECVGYDNVTNQCTSVQVVNVYVSEPPLTKEQANELTMIIVGFMVYVAVWKHILSMIR